MEKFKCSILTCLLMPCRTGQAGDCERKRGRVYMTLKKKHTRAYNMWNSKFFPRFISWVAALETGLTLPILLISGPLSDKCGRKEGKSRGVKLHQYCPQGLLWSLLLAGVLTRGVFALLVFLDKRGADLPLFCYLAPRCSQLKLSL